MLHFKLFLPLERATNNRPKSEVQFNEFETSHSREQYGHASNLYRLFESRKSRRS